MKEIVMYSLGEDDYGKPKNFIISVSKKSDIGDKPQEETPFEIIEQLINSPELIQNAKSGVKEVTLVDSKIEQKEIEINLENTKKIMEFLDTEEGINKETDLLDIMHQEVKEEISPENTKLIMDFLDTQLEARKPNKNLSNALEDELTEASNRREVLLSRGTNKIDLLNISFDEKNNKIDALQELSLDELEGRYGKKSEDLEALTNNSILKVANTFVKGYKGKIKDDIQVSNAYEEFVTKKAPKIIDEQVENSDIYKNYMSKMSKYVRESKPNDSAFMKLLNFYANLPAKILEEQFKEGLRDNLKKELSSQKDVTLGKIQKSFEDKAKKKSKGMER